MDRAPVCLHPLRDLSDKVLVGPTDLRADLSFSGQVAEVAVALENCWVPGGCSSPQTGVHSTADVLDRRSTNGVC